VAPDGAGLLGAALRAGRLGGGAARRRVAFPGPVARRKSAKADSPRFDSRSTTVSPHSSAPMGWALSLPSCRRLRGAW